MLNITRENFKKKESIGVTWGQLFNAQLKKLVAFFEKIVVVLQ